MIYNYTLKKNPITPRQPDFKGDLIADNHMTHRFDVAAAQTYVRGVQIRLPKILRADLKYHMSAWEMSSIRPHFRPLSADAKLTACSTLQVHLYSVETSSA
jgi:hypothetical protein